MERWSYLVGLYNSSVRNMEIRKAKIRDVRAITKVYNQAIRAGGLTGDLKVVSNENRRNWLSEHDGSKYPVYVAEINEKVVGYAYITQYRFGREAFCKTAEVSYYVNFENHGNGVGSALLEIMESYGREIGLEVFIAIILAINEKSISFMIKNGYEEWGRMKGIAHLGNQVVDHVYYGKRLK
jgi:L-amino acid N-acyltransferase YncA